MPAISRMLQGMNLPFGRGGAGAGYLKTLVTSDFFTSNVSVIGGKWTLVGEYTVPAQQQIRVGYGSPIYQKNQATVFIDTEDSSGDIDGYVRIQIADANDVVRPNGVVLEDRSENLSENSTDRTKQIPLPEYMPCTAKEDDKIQVWFKADADKTMSASKTTIRLPVTVYRL